MSPTATLPGHRDRVQLAVGASPFAPQSRFHKDAQADPLTGLPIGYPTPVSSLSYWQTEAAEVGSNSSPLNGATGSSNGATANGEGGGEEQAGLFDWFHPGPNGKTAKELLFTEECKDEVIDRLIIGSGISGSLAAYFLLNGEDSGAAQHDDPATTSRSPGAQPRTVLLEARSACSGATGRNGGHCRPDSFSGYSHFCSLSGATQAAAVLRNERETFELMRELMQCEETRKTKQDKGTTWGEECQWWEGKTCGVYLSAARKAKARRVWDAYAATGLLREGTGEGEVEWVEDEEEVIRRLRIPKAVGCTSWDAGSLQPLRFVHAVLRRCIELGLELYTHTPVLSLQAAANDGASGYRWKVKTSRGTLKARQVLLATNGYSTVLLPTLADFLTPHRAQCSAILPPPQYGGPKVDPVHQPNGKVGGNHYAPGAGDGDGDIAGDGRLAYTASISGFTPAPADYEYLTQRPSSRSGYLILGGGHPCAPISEQIGVFDDSVVMESVTEHLEQWPARTFEGWEEETEGGGAEGKGMKQVWTGIQGYTRDSVPIIGEVPAALLPSPSPPIQRQHGVNGEATLGSGASSAESTGLFLDLGHHGHGMARAATCSRGIARLMKAAQPDIASATTSATSTAFSTPSELPPSEATMSDETWSSLTSLPACFRWTEQRAGRRDVDCRQDF
ncbi:DAO-domain-containing protein [Microstroma glucosiphilum]|uniref:DAO-domain-containing protein n=1 Tax=Pseudomicrostroma glucosiphilum TaxID=1684307 RepID=A0A316U7N6_9BASI|nr:DAO-domain-containing protein [Pseudomicrostroma glucosiphilum]PWN20461.1 DAO-domain-containing protein [Pseudomicrostroma glucosiphilum]